MRHINPDTLRHLMGNMTQAQLIEKSQVGKATINRIFKGKVEKQNENTAERIAEALGVSVADLCKPIDKEAAANAGLQKLGKQMLRTTLDGEAWWNFDLVAQRYGISITDQLKFAPMAIALWADASLAERRQKLEARANAMRQVMENAQPYGDLHLAESYFDNEYWRDDESIRKRDIFGTWYWDDHVKNEAKAPFNHEETNPFADFLKRKIKEVSADLDLHGLDLLSESGLWEYRLCEGEFERITGGDPRAQMALNRCFVRLSDIPKDLLVDSKTQDRVAFLQSKLPDEIWAKHESDMAAFATMTLDDLGL